MKKLLAGLLLLMVTAIPVAAQNTTGMSIATCGTVPVAFKPSTTTQTFPGPFTVDSTGNMCVTGTLTGSVTITFPTIGAAVPATGIYNGLNVAGTLRGWSGIATGSLYSGSVAIVDASGNQVTSFGGSNASVSATGAAVPASATYAGINIGGNLVGAVGGHGTAASALRVELPTDGTGVIATVSAVTAITNALPAGTNVIGHIICDAGCSSSTAPADASTFTPGTTPQSPIGGFFQTTATNNPLTNLQMGAPQLTATRALFVNLRNASGTAIGVSGAALVVDGSAVTQPVSLASGAVASGAYASGALASGSIASGAMVDLVALSTPIAAASATATKGILLGGQYDSTQKTLTNGQQGGVSLSARAAVMVNPGAETFNVTVNAALPPGSAVIGTVNQASQYPTGATPYTASATGTTGATTATLAGASSVTTYICGFSIRANATAAATGNALVTGTITGSLNFTQWTAPNASGLGLTEMIFSPCVPASGTNQSIAVVSAAPGTGGVVSVTSWGYKL